MEFSGRQWNLVETANTGEGAREMSLQYKFPWQLTATGARRQPTTEVRRAHGTRCQRGGKSRYSCSCSWSSRISS